MLNQRWRWPRTHTVRPPPWPTNRSSLTPAAATRAGEVDGLIPFEGRRPPFTAPSAASESALPGGAASPSGCRPSRRRTPGRSTASVQCPGSRSGSGRTGGSGFPREKHHEHSWGSLGALVRRGKGRGKPALYSSWSTGIDPLFSLGGVTASAVPASARRRVTRISAARTVLTARAAPFRTRRRAADQDPLSDKSPQEPCSCPFTKFSYSSVARNKNRWMIIFLFWVFPALCVSA